MDPGNYDDYGGVVHAEYCFQVFFFYGFYHIFRLINASMYKALMSSISKFVENSISYHEHSF